MLIIVVHQKNPKIQKYFKDTIYNSIKTINFLRINLVEDAWDYYEEH